MGIIIICIILLLIAYVWRKGEIEPEFRKSAPAIMTSLGILGTFIGILIALLPLDFSAGKINDSISALLDGMTTAFFTSCAGLAAAIMSRIWWAKYPAKDPNDLTKSIEDALVKNLGNLIDKIQSVIVEKLSASLDELVKTINETINEKLGEKLDEFNKSVSNLDTWQKQHKDQVQTLTDTFQTVSGNMKNIKDSCAAIPATMNKLQEVIILAQEQTKELEERLEVFATMKKQAEDALPTITNHLGKIGNKLDKSVEAFNGLRETLNRAQSEMREISQKHTEEVNEIVKGMRKQTEAAITNIREDLQQQMGKIGKAWGDNLIAVAEECARAIKNQRDN